MWGRLNPHLGWKWRDENRKLHPYYLCELKLNAGMLTGMMVHSGVVATRPIQDFDRLSEDGEDWFPVSDLLALIPKEAGYGMPYPVVPVQVKYRMDNEEIL